jgi:hypothetical protein
VRRLRPSRLRHFASGLPGTMFAKSTFTGPLVPHKEENTMKPLVSVLAMALALAFTGPAFAGNVTNAKTAADCAKAGGMWDAKTNICSAKKM